MNNKLGVIIVIIILVGGGYYWYTSNEGQGAPKAEQQTESQDDKMKKVVQGFVEKYQPNMEISSDLQYTYQLEDALVKAGKPVVFTATVDDIFRKDGETYIRFAPSFFDYDVPRVFYTLKGCADKVDQITAVKKDIFGEYVVVAKITSIEKPIVRVNGSVSGEDVELELSEPQTFLATGSCLDLEYVEDAGADALFGKDNG